MTQTGSAKSGRLPWKNATLLAGPTASGKSSLALEIADRNDGAIVNTDSMQVYDILRVLTARPSPQDEAAFPHFLYGHVHPAQDYSTGHWLADAAQLLAQLDPGRHVIFTGGTGLYFRAILGGLSPMPQVDADIREKWRSRLLEEGAPALHGILSSMDAEAAKTLNPTDGQRIARALEVFDATQKSILWWQAQKGEPLVDTDSARLVVIEPDRAKLKARIEKRFDQMVDEGALVEVEAINKLDLDSAMPAMKAIGVPQLNDYMRGSSTLESAIELSKTATRQYAKRQMTWFRNQLDARWERLKI